MKGTPGRCQVAVTRQAADRRRSFAGSRRSTLDKQSNWLFARLRPLLTPQGGQEGPTPIRHQPEEFTMFPRAVQAKDDEIVIFSWVVYESRQSRDAVMAKVMADPRLKTDWSTMPFDGKRMIFGGFQPFMGL
jgi:hypothetical protein